MRWSTPPSRPGSQRTESCGSRANVIRCAAIPSRCSSTARRPTRRLRGHRGRSSSIAPGPRRKTMRRHYELPFGAELTAGGVRFRLWAPRAREVALLLEDTGASPHPAPPPLAGEGVQLREPGAAAIQMVTEADGWFAVTA